MQTPHTPSGPRGTSCDGPLLHATQPRREPDQRMRLSTLLWALALIACDSGGVRSATVADGRSGTTAPDVAINEAPLNTVETIIADMRELNDLPLAGVPNSPGWARGPGHVVMGNDPRGSRTPAAWRPRDPRLKSDAWWNALLPWLVVFDGVGHAATHTRVQVRQMRTFVLSRRSGQWSRVDADARLQGELYGKALTGAPVSSADLRMEGDGSVSIGIPGGERVFHGWNGARHPIDPADVLAVHVTLQARLIANGRDDRDQAKVLIQVGADYYPDRNTGPSAFAPESYNPGVGLSRAKRVSNAWQAFNFTTIDVGVQDPGGAAISAAVLRALPPPLQ